MLSHRYPILAKEAWFWLLLLLVLVFVGKFLAGTIVFLIFLSLLLAACYLFRDPHRIIPAKPLAVVSPVHGIVTLIEEAEEVHLKNKNKRIQITMRLHDIYSLRSPIEGKVIEQWSFEPDKNESRRHFDFHIRTDEGDDVIMAVRLSNIIRRFYVYLHAGVKVGQGQRCGYLYFGGVVDIFLPLESKIQVENGQYVHSGSTELARFIHANGTSTIVKP